jgi:hypothetical protein
MVGCNKVGLVLSAIRSFDKVIFAFLMVLLRVFGVFLSDCFFSVFVVGVVFFGGMVCYFFFIFLLSGQLWVNDIK